MSRGLGDVYKRQVFTLPSQAPNPGGMKRLPDEAGGAPAVEDPASMKPVE